MKLSLSVRIAESFSDKTRVTMSLDELVELARSLGFEALCMRASLAGVHTSREELEAMASKIRAAGLAVSMVTGDFAVPRNDEHGPAGLRKITPYLDLAELFGADLIRVCMKVDDDIAAARRAADEAAERGIRLAHQSHTASLFETVEGSVRVLRAVDRANFGLIYEPANWMISGQDYVAAVRTIEPWLVNVYVQNHSLSGAGQDSVETWTRGRVPLRHIGIWESGGVLYDDVMRALRDVGYGSYVTVHQAFAGVMPAAEAARRSRDWLAPRLGD